VEVITRDLVTLTQGLRRKLPKNRLLSGVAPGANKPTEDAEALDRLCERCVDIAEELMKRLNDLKVKPKEDKGKEGNGGGERERENKTPSTFFKTRTVKSRSGRSRTVILGDGSEASERPRGLQFRKWDSFRKALEASWDKKEIDNLAATLREFRSEIEFRMLISFRYSSTVEALCLCKED
jgi:hypothetical protein